MVYDRENIKSGGESRIFSVEAPDGPYGIAGGVTGLSNEQSIAEELDREKHLLKKFTMTEPGEAVFFYDAKMKHEVRYQLARENKDAIGRRKTLLAFTRRPLADGWDKDQAGVSYEIAEAELKKTGNVDRFFAEHDREFEQKKAKYEEVMKAKEHREKKAKSRSDRPGVAQSSDATDTWEEDACEATQ